MHVILYSSVQLFEVRGGWSSGWYWWNCWTSLL